MTRCTINNHMRMSNNSLFALKDSAKSHESDNSYGERMNIKRLRLESHYRQSNANRFPKNRKQALPVIGVVSSNLGNSDPAIQNEPNELDCQSFTRIILSSSAWRRLCFTRSPENLLRFSENEELDAPFPLHAEKSLAQFDDSTLLSQECDIVEKLLDHVTGEELQEYAVSKEELELSVCRSFDFITKHTEQCHRRRTKELLQYSRLQLQKRWVEVHLHRKRLRKIVSSCFSVYPITCLERKIFLTQRQCKQKRNTAPNACTFALYLEHERRKSTNQDEEAILIFPKVVLLLCQLKIPKHTGTCIGVNGLHRVQDDPIVRHDSKYVHDSKHNDILLKVPGREKIEAASTLYCEKKEYQLRYLMQKYGGNRAFFRQLQQIRLSSQPITDYRVLQQRELAMKVHNGRPCRQTSSDTLAMRLGPRYIQFLSSSFQSTSSAGAFLEDPQSIRPLCRMCHRYCCSLHNIQGRPSRPRIDPEYPPILSALNRCLKCNADTESGGSKIYPIMHDVEPKDMIAPVLTPEKDNSLRRSNRASTAECTKASTSLSAIISNKYFKPLLLMKLERCTHVDKSDYIGILLDDSLRETMKKVKDLLSNSDSWPFSVLEGDSARHLPNVDLTCMEREICAHSNACFGSNLRILQAFLKFFPGEKNSLQSGLTKNSSFTAIPRLNPTRTLEMHNEQFSRTLSLRGSVNHRFEPCNHHQIACTSSDCACIQRDHYCERACACPADCMNRFRGCQCAFGSCRTSECPCFRSKRECDPDKCTTCGAAEIAHLCFHTSFQFDMREYPTAPCGNVPILTRQFQKIRVAESEIHGLGAFARDNIPKGSFLYEYSGALLSQDEAERCGNANDSSAGSFLFDLNDDEVVDAMRMGNKSKFANHSSYKPNCEARIMLVRGEHRIGFFANCDIQCGQELFFNYRYRGVVPAWTCAPSDCTVNQDS